MNWSNDPAGTGATTYTTQGAATRRAERRAKPSASALLGTAPTVFFGVGVKTAYAIGALAYHIVAVGVAPLIGLSMEVLEIGQKLEEPPKSHIPGITDTVSSTGENKVLSRARKAIALLKEKFKE